MNALEPLLSRYGPSPNPTEIFAASFLPDAVEALTELDRADEAEPLVDALERNGRKQDRAVDAGGRSALPRHGASRPR